ncbi:MAG: nucleotidyltransferase family protein [Candidatus Eremiobacteraeota bacterium]|nr:nucleotidyltransferase family protein [Candidatus Eremiobacteraeota bacterium]
MIGVILAAGAGTRLRPLTDDVPKPMIRLHGMPILEYNVRLLVRHGIADIVMNTWYKPEAIRAYFGDGSGFGARIAYSDERELRGTAGALAPIRARLTEPFLVVYGDNLTDLDVAALCRTHRESGAEMTIALFERDGVQASGVAELAEDDRIVGFVEKPEDGRRRGWVNAGVLCAQPDVLAYVPDDGPSDFGRDVIPALLREGRRIQGYRMREHLWWIDTNEDYERTSADPDLLAFARDVAAPRG